MKIKTIIITVVVLALAGGGAWGYFHYKRAADNRPREYETAAVTRGTVERVIVSTGTLDPVGSVEVGTQVSGTVDRVLVDFNDTVRAGQVIAEIDKSVLISRLSEAQASLSRAEALFAQSEQEFKRGEVLFEKGLISEQEFVRARTDYLTQKASHQVAKAAVNTAAENVRYATIRSPVRGTVISRNVDVGQTVAASLSAPTLFIIAEDLKNMKIMALVDETDIGKIRPSQQVRFSVQAYPEKKYAGTVSQVRLQPEIIQNVVTYSVVILARNDDGTLLPGMTANVEFVEAREEGALVVPASAFRFQPPEDVAQKFRDAAKEAGVGAHRRRDGGAHGDSAGAPLMAAGDSGRGGRRQGGDGPMARAVGGDGRSAERQDGTRQGGKQGGGKKRQQASLEPGSRAVIWSLDGNGELKPVFVRVLLSDGVQAAVASRGDDLTEGLRIVTGEVKQDKKKSGGKQNRSLLPQQGPGGRPASVPRRM